MNPFGDLRRADASEVELIRLCGEHIANHAAYNADCSGLEPGDNPLWHAYLRTYRAIRDAVPQTLVGIVAKARATKAEATNPDGTVEPEDATDWAWDLVEDLIRLGDAD
jgi:hypothetical protein